MSMDTNYSTSELITLFVDGETTATEEQTLFSSLLADNATRAELRRAFTMQSHMASVAATTVPTALDAQILQKAGFAQATTTAPQLIQTGVWKRYAKATALFVAGFLLGPILWGIAAQSHSNSTNNELAWQHGTLHQQTAQAGQHNSNPLSARTNPQVINLPEPKIKYIKVVTPCTHFANTASAKTAADENIVNNKEVEQSPKQDVNNANLAHATQQQEHSSESTEATVNNSSHLPYTIEPVLQLKAQSVPESDFITPISSVYAPVAPISKGMEIPMAVEVKGVQSLWYSGDKTDPLVQPNLFDNCSIGLLWLATENHHIGFTAGREVFPVYMVRSYSNYKVVNGTSLNADSVVQSVVTDESLPEALANSVQRGTGGSLVVPQYLPITSINWVGATYEYQNSLSFIHENMKGSALLTMGATTVSPFTRIGVGVSYMFGKNIAIAASLENMALYLHNSGTTSIASKLSFGYGIRVTL